MDPTSRMCGLDSNSGGPDNLIMTLHRDKSVNSGKRRVLIFYLVGLWMTFSNDVRNLGLSLCRAAPKYSLWDVFLREAIVVLV